MVEIYPQHQQQQELVDDVSVCMRVCAGSQAAAHVGRRRLSGGARSSTYAQVFSGVGKPLELREIAIPPLEAGQVRPCHPSPQPAQAVDEADGSMYVCMHQVLLELELATICGSDLHTISGLRSSPTPLVLGHEGVGRVAASRRAGIGGMSVCSLAEP